jgi:hypothetical protein
LLLLGNRGARPSEAPLRTHAHKGAAPAAAFCQASSSHRSISSRQPRLDTPAMLHFSSSFKLALSVLGLFILAVASAPGSFTRSTLGLLARDAREHGHHYVAPTETDSRSPCPALNVLANHGYL